MPKHAKGGKDEDAEDEGTRSADGKGYKEQLYDLQVELVKLQRHVIAANLKVLLLFEGRDAAGKDGVIKRIVQHLSPRETRVVALGKPTERETTAWYFQRWVPHLPTSDEIVCLNRSWYNRAGVESVMGFCTEAQTEEFFETVPAFEQMLTRSGILLHKYYLDIDKATQRTRLEKRRRDPLSQWKISPIDAAAQKHWKDYSRARDLMLARTHTPAAPWTIVKADDKKKARLALIRDILARIDYEDRKEEHLLQDPSVLFRYGPSVIEDGLLAK